MQLSNNITSGLALFAKLPQQKIARIVSVLLLAYLAFLLAKLVWLVITPEPKAYQTVNNTSVSTKSTTASNVNISQFLSLDLFGIYNPDEAVVEEEDEIINAPQTQLNLTLSGVVPSDDDETASAIIEHKGKQETLGIGDKIADTRATLDKVYFDRVIIKRAGISETLMLDGLDFNQVSVTSAQKVNKKPVKSTRNKNVKSSLDNRDNNRLKQQVNDLKSVISKDPGKITDYLRITPKNVEQKTVGYFLRPGKQPEFFKASGLKAGDVAIQLNGYDLTSALDAAQALQALKTESEVTLLVDRDGDVTEILFSIEN